MSIDFNKGNIGEWSELYTFFYLLSEGKLQVADENLVAIPNEYYKIIEILRKENNSDKRYIRNDSIVHVIVQGITEAKELNIPIQHFIDCSKTLYSILKKDNKEDRQNKLCLQPFCEEMSIESVKDVGHKRDITIKIEDYRCNLTQELGFSIKSLIGGPSSLFNPGDGTNFIYKIVFPEGTSFDVQDFNKITVNQGKSSKIHNRIVSLEQDYHAKIDFVKTQSPTLMNNIRLIDGDLPKILAYALLERYRSNCISINKCVNKLNQSNPMNYFDLDKFPFYEYKIKKLLHDMALGMTSETPWKGIYDANGGFIIVKDSGEVVCYHIYEQNRFLQFLFNNTRFEQASTGEDKTNPGTQDICAKKKYYYGWVYQEEGCYFIKINLQIRMTE